MFPADPTAHAWTGRAAARHPQPTGLGAAGAGAGDGGPGAANGWQPAAGGPPAAPSVTLPKGGGAIRDIGEKFSVSAATGTAGLTVPVATSPGRAGFGPSLSLDYDSGAGNSPFGLGWHVSLPAITRKTDKGLPRYHDDPDLDTFILSGAEDLVPVREEREGRLAAGAEPGGPSAAAATSSRATGRASRGCSRGSSAGVTSAPARRTGGRSASPTSPRSTAPPPPAASRTPPTRRACSAG